MKHIIQISSYYPPHLGGQENVVRDLAQQLAGTGNEVHVLTSSQGGGQKGLQKEGSVSVSRMWGFVFGHAPVMPWFPIELFRTARTNSVVHLHIGQAFTPEMVWLVSKLRRFRYIAELHIDFEPTGPAGLLLPLYKRFVLKRALGAASAIIVLNEKTLRAVRGTYGYTGRAEVMSNGTDEVYYMLKRKPLSARPPKVLNLLFVGRLSKQKNVTTLLQALHETKRRVHLDVIGEGEEGAAIQKMVADYNLTNVTMHGRQTPKEVMHFYKTCDALVMPSLYEAQPLVLLEAMAARIPVIGTNVIGVVDHIQDGGIIVEPTVEGLVDGIEQYYTHYSSLADMVQRGYDMAEKFRWKHTLKEYEELYETVAAD